MLLKTAASNLVLTFGLLVLSTTASAQTQNNKFTGIVLSPMETAIAGATITLTNSQTSASQTSTSNQSGEYTFPAIAPGRYEFSVSADGFRKYVRHSFLAGESPVRVEVRLQPEKDDVGSVQQLEASLAEKPDDPVTQFNLGRAYFAARDVEKARRQFERLLETHPDYTPAQMVLVQLAMNRGDNRTALAYAVEMRKLHPDNIAAMLVEAAAYMRMGMFEEARETLDAVLKINPNNDEALLDLGLLSIARKRYAEAEEPFRRAYRLDPTNLRGLQGLAEIRILMQTPEKAVQVIAAEVEQDPQRRDLRVELAAVEMRTKQYDRAIADYQAVLDKYHNSPAEQGEMLTHMGDAYGMSGDLPRAIDSLVRATKLIPDSVVCFSTLAALYDRAGKKPDAINAYQAALKLDPNNAIVLNNLAYIIADTGGDLDQALRMAQKARQQMPELAAILDTVGWIYLKKGLSDSAVRVFEDLVERNRTNASFHYHFAMALVQKGDRPAAMKEFDQALKNNPSKEEEAMIRESMKKLP